MASRTRLLPVRPLMGDTLGLPPTTDRINANKGLQWRMVTERGDWNNYTSKMVGFVPDDLEATPVYDDLYIEVEQAWDDYLRVRAMLNSIRSLSDA